MVYYGYCDKQKKDYSVNFTSINANALEDFSPKSINGRLNCAYAGKTDCCTHPSQCSILKNYSK